MKFLTIVVCFLGLTSPISAQDPAPIIDVHLHAFGADQQGPPPLGLCTPATEFPAWDPAQPWRATLMRVTKDPPCDDPVWSPDTDEELMRQTVEVMERRNIIGVLSGSPERVAQWMEAAPDRFIPGLHFNAARTGISPDSLRALVESGRVQVLAEVVNQYAGMAPDDERMEAYWAMAEALDIPVGIHMGPGAPGAIYLGLDGYRVRLGDPLGLEPVLVRHPTLRVYIMHAGYPLINNLLALMHAHPQVYVGTGEIIFTRPDFDNYLRAMVEAGFGNRVMFGSDQMVWPGVIDRAIDRIQHADFLTERQKRDILYRNAVRFFRLEPLHRNE